jgi:hypothetical protein
MNIDQAVWKRLGVQIRLLNAGFICLCAVPRTLPHAGPGQFAVCAVMLAEVLQSAIPAAVSLCLQGPLGLPRLSCPCTCQVHLRRITSESAAVRFIYAVSLVSQLLSGSSTPYH